ncbi:MAG: hypothetical protein NZ519_09155 [Bacteroidia bacterium]|nr:hypothetical protein [Bacteroidia bacterium]
MRSAAKHRSVSVVRNAPTRALARGTPKKSKNQIIFRPKVTFLLFLPQWKLLKPIIPHK